jgi:hypothetical protein
MASSPEHVVSEEDISKSPQGHTNGKEAHPPLPDNIREAMPSTPTKKPLLIKRIWKRLGINGVVMMIMVKPAVAATISMAIYQKKSVAAHYLNFGYLIIIVSITTVPILPRGKFLLNLFLSVVSYLLLRVSFPLRLRFPLFQMIVVCDWLTIHVQLVPDLFCCWNGRFGSMGGYQGSTTYNTTGSISCRC